MTSSVRERSYTNKKEALVLKRQPRASLANFLSQYLTFQSVLAFLDVDPKNTLNKELCCLRSFPAGNGSQKAVLVRAPKRAPDFGFLRRKYKLTQFGSQTGAQTGEPFLGPNYADSSRAEATSAYTAGRCVQK